MDRQHQQPREGFHPERIDELTTGLRRLARGLVRSDADAEDLVQDAWVAALRSPPDDERRLGGWLRRTLRNLAADRRLGEARRARHEQAAAESEVSADAGHEQIETLRALLAEVAALPEPYRTVVRLRYLEGEPPRRIAKRLGIPATTVHTRIQRGLARLRERLDARSGGDRKAWLTALLPLARPEGALLGVGTLAGVAVLMKAQVAALVAVFVLGGGGAATWWLMGNDEVARVEVGSDSADDAPQVRVAELPGSEVGEMDRESVSIEEAPSVAAPSSLARVRGRCVDEATGMPLSGVVATLDGHKTGDPLEALRAGDMTWTVPDPVESDADGRFEIAFTPHPAYQHGLEVAAYGYAPRTGRWGPFRPGQVEDLGEVRMTSGHRVEGLVLGQDDLPRERVALEIRDLPSPLRPGMAARNGLGGLSGADGRFAISTAIPAGIWPLHLIFGGHLISPASVTVPLTEPLIVRVADVKSVRGRVVDREGRPFARVYVSAGNAAGSFLQPSQTNAEGRFAILQRRPDDGPPVWIGVDDLFTGHRVPSTRIEVGTEWGEDGLEIRVERTGLLELVVLDEDTGEPIESFAVRLYPDSGSGGTIRDLREGGTHPEGRLEVHGLEQGDNVLVVVPKEPRWIASAAQKVRYDGQPLEDPLEIRLRRALQLQARVVDRNGSPIAGAEVELIDPGTGQLVEVTTATPFTSKRSILQGHSFDRARPFPSLISSEITGEDGRCVLIHHPDHEGEVALRAGKEGFGKDLRFVRAEPGVEVELELGPPTTVTGRITTDFSAYRQGSQQVWLVDGDESALDGAQHVEVLADGSFSFPDAMPGRYDLELRLSRSFGWGGGRSGTRLVPAEPLRTGLEIVAGQSLDLGEITLDLRPATVTGRVTIDGAPPTAARLWFAGAVGFAWSGTLGAYAVAADGSFEVADLPPGRWQPFVAVGCDEHRCLSWARAGEVIEVRPGERSQVTVEVPRRVVRVQVVDQEDRPLPDVPVEVWPQGGGQGARGFQRVTDAAGSFVLDPAPDLELVLRADERRTLGSSEPRRVRPIEGVGGPPIEVTLRIRVE